MDFEKLAESKVAPIYVIASGDALLLQRAQSRIRELVVAEATQAFNYEVLEGKGTTAARILAAVQILPMLAKRRMVVVRDITAVASEDRLLDPRNSQRGDRSSQDWSRGRIAANNRRTFFMSHRTRLVFVAGLGVLLLTSTAW